MDRKPGKRQDWNAPGHAHELTLSCYKRLKLFSQPDICRIFLAALDEVRKELEYDVWAYVVMPEHVHLLVRSRHREYRIQDFRRELKKRVGLRALAWIKQYRPAALSKLVAKEGTVARRRFWQDGKGYDRNLWTPPLIWRSIRYIHNNPVKRGLCKAALDWPWSSYRWFLKLSPVEFECDLCPVDPPNPESGVWETWWEPE